MFDPETVELIRGAPALGGLDTDTLPERLTAAYSRIVALRMRLAQADDESPVELLAELQGIRRLANTYEVYATALTEASDRESAAFVAATAHQLLFKAEERNWLPRRSLGRLHRDSISSDISSTLLFLIAGYPSDAVEASNLIRWQDENRIQAGVLVAVVHLARGELESVLRIETPDVPSSGPADDERALLRLWQMILQAIRGLATQMLDGSARSERAATDPFRTLQVVQQLAVAEFNVGDQVPLDGVQAPVFHAYAGPHHLATLLLSAGGRLLREAVVNVPSPPTLDTEAWTGYLQRLARKRPYLWSNHLDAINRGYLHPGVSAAVSFPTGAGKSTLTELKMAATLLQGKSVVYLAPTLALVSQVLATLRVAFSQYAIVESLLSDGFYAEVEEPTIGQVVVMTPERCLTLLGIDEQIFSGVGLIAFDECHLLHRREGVGDRRSLDSMLCLLALLEAAPDADVLLMSAMMSNAQELSDWLTEAMGRKCLALTLTWKPTRQARACVVFEADRIRELEEAVLPNLRARSAATSRRRRPAAALSALPYGLFGLTQSWTIHSEDYALLQLLNHDVPLTQSTTTRKLTPNKNEVAAILASRMAAKGIKTLIFVQNRSYCQSVAEKAARYPGRPDSGPIALTANEEAWRTAAVEDLGGEEHLLGPVGNMAAPHQALLLPAERLLNESLFARQGGINILVATPTLAQGMNLPAEAVIIAGDGRFDRATQKSEQLYAHELLNAAGRAGRAGHHASGVVLVIPNELVAYDAQAGVVGRGWITLQQNVFSKSDQCLKIEDPVEGLLDAIYAGLQENPVTNLLDRIQQAADIDARLIRYFLTRLSVEGQEDDGQPTHLLNRSLAAYHARRTGIQDDFAKKLQVALQARVYVAASAEAEPWADHLARITGLPVVRIGEVKTELEAVPIPSAASTTDCLAWLFQWFARDPRRFSDLVDPRALGEVISKSELDAYVVTREPGQQLLNRIQSWILGWMTGKTLNELEVLFGLGVARGGRCKRARQFIRGMVREISYAAGLIAQVERERRALSGSSEGLGLGLATVAACIKEGFDHPEKLAVRSIVGPHISRVACHKIHLRITQAIEPLDPLESFTSTRRRVREALNSAA